MTNHFIIPKKYYQLTFISLLILTVFTVLIARVDLGFLNTPVALAVAIFKSTLVGAFFMGLRWEKANLIFVFGAIAALILFFLFTFVDFASRGAITDEVSHPYGFKSPVTIINPNDSTHKKTMNGDH